jgi:hypothetical protein
MLESVASETTHSPWPLLKLTSRRNNQWCTGYTSYDRSFGRESSSGPAGKHGIGSRSTT